MKWILFEYLNCRQGQFFSPRHIAKALGMTIGQVNLTVKDLHDIVEIQKLVSGRWAVGIPMTAVVKKHRKPFSELKFGLDMQIALKRCRDARGGEYHAITIS
jgi:hypothetical protein